MASSLIDFPKRIRFFLIPFFGGVIYCLGFPNNIVSPFFLYSIAGIVLAFLCLELGFVADERRPLRILPNFATAVSFCLGINLMGFYWVPHTLQEFGALSPSLSYTVSLLFTLIVFPQIFCFVFILGFSKRLASRTFLRSTSPDTKALFYALLMVFSEQFVPQQFPIHLGYPWMTIAPFLGLAPLFGAAVFSFVSYWFAFSLAFQIKERTIRYLPWTVFFLFIFFNFHNPLPSPEKGAVDKINVKVIQPNIGNFLKLDSEAGNYSSIHEVLETYKELSISGDDADLIVWPETAYPHVLSTTKMSNNSIFTPPEVTEVVQKTESYLFTGGYARASNNEDGFMNQYNSALLFDEKGILRDIYHKIMLIPFGETLPFGRFNRYLSSYIDNISYFAQGDTFEVFKLPGGRNFITAICYEVLFSSFIRDFLNSAESSPHFIINLTNDSWYGDTSEPHQHLFLAKWRAIEFNLPVIRSTNTGITSVLYQDGSEGKKMGIGQRASMVYPIPLRVAQPTLYQRFGLWMSAAFIVAAFALHILSRAVSILYSRLLGRRRRLTFEKNRLL